MRLCAQALAIGAAILIAAGGQVVAQTPAPLTGAQHQSLMLQKLGIASIRPAYSSETKAPNAANYDEAKANPYPVLPDPLLMDDGRPVRTAAQWQGERRPQIVRAYEQAVYGRVPANAPKVTWTVVATDREQLAPDGSLPVLARRVIGHVDNAAYPSVKVEIRMMVVTPARAPGPVPLLLMLTSDQYSGDKFPMPSQPTLAELDTLNDALRAVLARQDPAVAAIFAAHPGFSLIAPGAAPVWPAKTSNGDPASIQQLIAAGWGYATLDTTSIQPDNADGLSRGVIGLTAKGRLRDPEDWGALRAWAWGASRALDYFETDPAIDARRVGIEGVSRYGKAALVTMAFDPRFAIALIGSSGKGGVTPLRRSFGEDVTNLANPGAFHWMAGNFLKYAGPLTPKDLPVDSNELIALAAPRPVFISYGVPEQGDALWLDQRGSWMATNAASPVFTLLGAKGLDGTSADYQTRPMPAVNEGLLGGDLAWRQHDGGHTDAPNMKSFLQWAASRPGLNSGRQP